MLKFLTKREPVDELDPSRRRVDEFAPVVIVLAMLAGKIAADQLADRHAQLCEALSYERSARRDVIAERDHLAELLGDYQRQAVDVDEHADEAIAIVTDPPFSRSDDQAESENGSSSSRSEPPVSD